MSAIPPQIAKLIPRLASEHDGEVVATVRAIERVLRTTGLDWHAIAAVVEVPEPTAFTYDCTGFYSRPAPQRSQPQSAPPKPKAPQFNWSEMTRFAQLAWCDILIEADKLDAKTLELVYEVRNKLCFGMDFHLAPKHKRKLTALIKAVIEADNAARAAA